MTLGRAGPRPPGPGTRTAEEQDGDPWPAPLSGTTGGRGPRTRTVARVTDSSTQSPVRVRIDLSYDGTGFAGWATQPGLRTVQGTLEVALGTVLRCPDPRLTVAGRTDAGVHARGQVAHVDLDRQVWEGAHGRRGSGPSDVLLRRLAGILPPDIVVHRTEPAPPGFDARYSALHRRYAYRLSDHISQVDPLRRTHVVRHRFPLDVAAMSEAAVGLVGRHDFAAYCRPRPGATTIRTLQVLDVARPTTGPDTGLVAVVVQADAFCHTMVRSLVGALLTVGEGRRPVSWPADQLAGGRRDGGSLVAPAHGLTLEEVVYPPAEQLKARAERTRARRQRGGPAGTDSPDDPVGAD